jgi:hypothetical protein
MTCQFRLDDTTWTQDIRPRDRCDVKPEFKKPAKDFNKEDAEEASAVVYFGHLLLLLCG